MCVKSEDDDRFISVILYLITIALFCFIRYGFHKVNKSPRGHRALAENQIWEFSHPKFLRGRGDLLEEIKRKALDTDVVRRDQSDIGTHMAVMQVAQSDMMQQLAQLQQNFNELVRELQDTRKRQAAQQQTMKQLMNYMIHQHGVSCKSFKRGSKGTWKS